MEVYVRGSRSSSLDWVRAQELPANELPPLDEKQKERARRNNVPEEAFARTEYAQQLTAQATLQWLLKFGQWLEGQIEELGSDGKIRSIELDTWSGKIHVEGVTGSEQFSFALEEDVVERFLSTGASELEAAILRVLKIFVLTERAKAS